MACTREVAFGVNLIGNNGAAPADEASSLAGWAPVGSRTTLSAHVEKDDPPAAMLPAVDDGGREHRPSGSRYVLAARRDGEEDGLRHPVRRRARARVTYRVAGWVAVQSGGGEHAGRESHVVRVSLHVDDGGECRVLGCGAVCAGWPAAGWRSTARSALRRPARRDGGARPRRASRRRREAHGPPCVRRRPQGAVQASQGEDRQGKTTSLTLNDHIN